MTRHPARRRRWLSLLALLLSFAMIAAACGDDDDGGEGAADDEPGEGASEPGTETDLPEDQPEGEPAPGGEVVYGLEAGTTSFCLPEAQLAISGIQVARTLYDTLTAPDANGEIQPFLAESFEANETFDEWTITLREGVTFHDGSPLTAEVVKNNLDAYRGAYEGRQPLLFSFVLEDVEAVEAPDERTVVIRTVRPWVALPWTLWSSGRMGMVAQAQLDSENCETQLIGTGPFMLEGAFEVGTDLVTTKFPEYWQTDENGTQLPYLDGITYQAISEVDQRINALETNQIQMMHTSSTEQIAERLQPLADQDQINLTTSDAFGEVDYLMLNVSQPPFDNINARTAASHALDRELLIELRGGGLGEVATGPFQSDVIGHVEDTGLPLFDLEAAQQAAEAYQADTGQPLSFTYTFSATADGQLTAQEIQTQMGEAGIEMALDPVGDQATLINEALQGNFQAVGWRNHPGADPDTQYNWWYEGSPVNFGRIADDEINRLLDEGRTNPDDSARVQAYEDLNRRFGEQVYNLWTSFTLWGIGTSPEVFGIFGPNLPDGGEPFPGLATGHPVSGLYVNTQ